MFLAAKELAETLGIEAGRLRLEWISSAEGTRFAEVAGEFTQKIQSLGPLKITAAA
jgi:F420-non-reducing hydrogenase iron-sulfur subunit